MSIERKKVIDEFQAYVENYDMEDTKIRLKADHTYRVAGLSEIIAKSLGLSGADVDLAWLIGMLHDLGRFDQLRQYGTFIDAQSVDHALLAVEILFEEGTIRRFIQESENDELIRSAIRYHNAYLLPEDLDERTLQFCNLIRDADKIDIIRVNVEIPLEEIYNVSSEEIYQSDVTEEVIAALESGDTVLRSLKKTPADYLVGHISFVNGLVYPKSRQLMKEQGYLEKMLEFPTKNPDTKKQFERMKRFILTKV
ncbi:MAG: HD domain-containing protein [Hespellia sp.]|nr:HD domain-containing protein [Hespellia sp.]